MKKLIVFFGLLVLGFGLLIRLIIHTGVDNILRALQQFSIYHFLILCALTAINFLLYAWRWKIILRNFAEQNTVNFLTLYMARTSAFSVGYMTPFLQVGGEPVRVYFLEKNGVARKEAIASVVVDKTLESTAFVALSIMGVAMGFYFNLFEGKISVVLWRSLIGAIIFLFTLYYAIFFKSGFVSKIMRILNLTRFKTMHRFERKVAEIEDLMSDFCTGHRLRFYFLMFISCVNVLVYVLEHFVLALFLGAKLTVIQSFLVTSIPNSAYLIPIPGALGALESLHVLVFGLLGVTINAIALVLILRVRDFLIVLIGIIYASGHGFHLVREAFGKKTPPPC